MLVVHGEDVLTLNSNWHVQRVFGHRFWHCLAHTRGALPPPPSSSNEVGIRLDAHFFFVCRMFLFSLLLLQLRAYTVVRILVFRDRHRVLELRC